MFNSTMICLLKSPWGQLFNSRAGKMELGVLQVDMNKNNWMIDWIRTVEWLIAGGLMLELQEGTSSVERHKRDVRPKINYGKKQERLSTICPRRTIKSRVTLPCCALQENSCCTSSAVLSSEWPAVDNLSRRHRNGLIPPSPVSSDDHSATGEGMSCSRSHSGRRQLGKRASQIAGLHPLCIPGRGSSANLTFITIQ